VGEHQMNDSAIFFHIAFFGNAALHTENAALLVACVTNFELLKVAKTNDLSTRNALNQFKAPPHSYNVSTQAWYDW